MFFEATKYSNPDRERTAQEQQYAQQQAQKAREQIVGKAVLSGDNIEEARAAADAEFNRIASSFYVWVNVDPEVIYPAAINYLMEALPRLVGLCGLSDGELVKKALGGDDEAKFIAQSAGKLMIYEVRDALAGAGEAAWTLALTPRSEFDDQDEDEKLVIKAREALLEAVRRFFTEAIQQKIETGRVGVYISKNEDWKL